MNTIEDIIRTAMALAGRGDKPSSDDLAEALRILHLILKDWATTKGVLLWNLTDMSISLPPGTIVLHNDQYYQCYVDHTSSTDDEPGLGSRWQDFWIPTLEIREPLNWVVDLAYTVNRTLTLSNSSISDILGVRIQHHGQFSPLTKITTTDFLKLATNEAGLPTQVFVQKTENGQVLHMHPINNHDDVSVFCYAVSAPPEYSADGVTQMEGAWVQALQYALSVELGFMYNIELNRLNVLGQKAAYEFAKAYRINESEIDECYIKPLY